MSEIELRPVYQDGKEHNLQREGYDPETRTLQLEFQGGGLYAYDEIPPELYERFLAAESKGKFFHAEIRKGGYKFKKVK